MTRQNYGAAGALAFCAKYWERGLRERPLGRRREEHAESHGAERFPHSCTAYGRWNLPSARPLSGPSGALGAPGDALGARNSDGKLGDWMGSQTRTLD